MPLVFIRFLLPCFKINVDIACHVGFRGHEIRGALPEVISNPQ